MQEVFWQYRDDDSTFRLNWRDLLIIPHGRYRGFEWTEKLPSTMNLRLSHELTGGTKVKEDLTNSSVMGVWKSKQGVVITEDSNIVLAIATGHPTLNRIDLIVGEHQYIATQGGAAAVYSVISGTPSTNPIAPSLIVPEKQVILGELYIPAGTTTLGNTGVKYTPADNPNMGDDPYIMKTNKVQTSTELKVFNVQKGMVVITELDLTSHKIISNTPSNIYVISDINGLPYTPYELVKGFTFEYAEPGQEITIFTEISLRLEDNISTGNGNLAIPEGIRYVEAGTTFKMVKIAYYGGFSCWTLVGGDAVKGMNNKFRGNQIFDKTTTATVVSYDIVFGNKGGNYCDIAAFPIPKEVRFIQSHKVLSGTLNKTDEAGAIIYIRINSTVFFRNNATIGLSVNSKPILFPTNKDHIFPTGTILMLLEDTDFYRVLSVWNADLSVLTLKAMKLNDLNDVTTANEGEGDILIKGPQSLNNGDWYNTPAQAFIENLALVMNKRIALKYWQGMFSNTGIPGNIVAHTGGINEFSFEGNVMKWSVAPNYFASAFSTIKCGADAEVGTSIYFILEENAGIEIFYNASNPSGTLKFLPTRDTTTTSKMYWGKTVLKFTCGWHSFGGSLGQTEKVWFVEESDDATMKADKFFNLTAAEANSWISGLGIGNMITWAINAYDQDLDNNQFYQILNGFIKIFTNPLAPVSFNFGGGNTTINGINTATWRGALQVPQTVAYVDFDGGDIGANNAANNGVYRTLYNAFAVNDVYGQYIRGTTGITQTTSFRITLSSNFDLVGCIAIVNFTGQRESLIINLNGNMGNVAGSPANTVVYIDVNEIGGIAYPASNKRIFVHILKAY